MNWVRCVLNHRITGMTQDTGTNEYERLEKAGVHDIIYDRHEMPDHRYSYEIYWKRKWHLPSAKN